MKSFHRSVFVICCWVTKHLASCYAPQFCGSTGFFWRPSVWLWLGCCLGPQSHQKARLGWSSRMVHWHGRWLMVLVGSELRGFPDLRTYMGFLMAWWLASKNKYLPRVSVLKAGSGIWPVTGCVQNWHMATFSLFYGSKQCQGPPGYWKVGKQIPALDGGASGSPCRRTCKMGDIFAVFFGKYSLL